MVRTGGRCRASGLGEGVAEAEPGAVEVAVGGKREAWEERLCTSGKGWTPFGGSGGSREKPDQERGVRQQAWG